MQKNKMTELLIVDKEKLITDLLYMVIKRFFKNVHVSIYNNSDEAILRIEKGEVFDIVMTSLRNHTGKKSFEIFKAIRKKSQKTKIIVISGGATQDDLKMASHDAFLEKPFREIRQIINIIEKMAK